MTSQTETDFGTIDEQERSDIDLLSESVTIRTVNDRVNIDSLVETDTEPQTELTQTQSLKTDRSQRLLQFAASQAGQTSIMLALLGLTLSVQFNSQLWLIGAGIAVWLTRSVIIARANSNSLGLKRKLRTNLTELFKEEMMIGIWFIAAASLFGWPPSGLECLLFLVANLVSQAAVMFILRENVINDSERNLSWSEAKTDSIIIAGSGVKAQRMADKIIEQTELGINIKGFVDAERRGLWRYRDIPLLGQPADLETIVADHRVDLLLIANDESNHENSQQLFGLAETLGLPIAMLVDAVKPKIAKPITNSIAGQPLVLYHCAPQNRKSLALKSIFDRTLAFFGLIMISPVLLLTAILVKTESRGPVFFKQVRSGLNGRPFKIYKFRTMCADAESQKASLAKQNEMSGPVFKIKADPRITRLGRYLRKYSIDELPQLINVVKGEMSLVGPRPPLPKEVAGMKPWQRRKLTVLPGVTCTWQVSGRNAIDFEEWMQLDLDYIDSWSLWSDVKLIARTIPTVLRGSGS